ncbi:MAG TPA: DUF6763 family protein [Gammaproteobacteria bacterium]|nr:DUF6763 family protein [Gammaproteobacteria bacterium]
MDELEFPPVAVGDWYQTMTGELLEVVAADESEDTIEVQYFDGTVAELDTESWYENIRGPASPPEDWSGSLDISREDYGIDAGDAASDFRDPRQYLDGA